MLTVEQIEAIRTKAKGNKHASSDWTELWFNEVEALCYQALEALKQAPKPDLEIKPSEYQLLAARTECDQLKACARMMGVSEITPAGPPEHLIPIRLNHAVIGLAGEVGELAGAVERWIYYNKGLDTANVKEELGDCMWYIALACNAVKLALGNDVMAGNIRKLSIRYPEKYTDYHAAEENRNRAKEAQAMEGK